MLYNEETRQDILKRLSGYRLRHTLGCEKAAVKLAERYGENLKKCAFAALLHDITKGFSAQEQLYLCKKYGIMTCDVEKKTAKILHGKTAAKIAEVEYDAPHEITEAIACHTTGKRGMTQLDKIIYLADFIEETRVFEGVEPARKLAEVNLDEAMLYCFDFSIRELLERKLLIHPGTIEARNYLIENLK